MSAQHSLKGNAPARRRVAVVATFAVSVALSVVAATHRFGDSAHAMGMISERGGSARHPVQLPPGRGRYTLVVTASVIPPYRGDVEVSLEGEPAPGFAVHPSEPVIDLGLRRIPHFRDGAFRGVEPGDRLAMWLAITPPPVDPVCGHPRGPDFITARHDGRSHWFCSADCRDAFLADPDRPSARWALAGAYNIVLRDLESQRPVLTIPVILGSGGGHGHEH